MTYQHLFGPVASRRLGVSLGVDLVVHKVCSLDCVYCECGQTTDLTLERKSWVPFDRVCQELDHYFVNNEDPDYITFSGSGEPCLNKDLGRVIEYIKHHRPGIRVAVLTNATLLTDHKVRQELALADLVVPSLDAVSKAAFRKINRPIKGLDPDDIIKGIQAFRTDFPGRLHLEIFILEGINDNDGELALFKQAIADIKPDLVQLNALDRPGTCSFVKPASRLALERIKNYLGPDKMEIIARVPAEKTAGSGRAGSNLKESLEQAILETIHRRPSTCRDLASMLGADVSDVQVLLDRLVDRGDAVFNKQDRGIFYQTRKTPA